MKHWLIGEVYMHEEEIRKLGINPEKNGSWYMSVTERV